MFIIGCCVDAVIVGGGLLIVGVWCLLCLFVSSCLVVYLFRLTTGCLVCWLRWFGFWVVATLVVGFVCWWFVQLL